MARILGKAADIFVDEFLFDDETNGVEIDIDNGLGDVTAFADTDATFVEGKAGFTLGINGLWSTASENYDGEMFTDLTAADRRVGIYPNAATAGERGYEGATNISAAPRVSETESAIALNVTWRGDTPLGRSWSLMRNTGQGSGTTNGTAYQAGAVTASQTIVGVLRCMGSSGGVDRTLDVTIQSASDEAFTTPNTRLTFTQITTVAAFEVQTLAGANTDTWWRARAVVAGTSTPSFDMFVAFYIRTT